MRNVKDTVHFLKVQFVKITYFCIFQPLTGIPINRLSSLSFIFYLSIICYNCVPSQVALLCLDFENEITAAAADTHIRRTRVARA